MATAAEIQAKLTKLELNMDRLDIIVNGGSTTDVPIDVGTVPTISKFLATIGTTAGGYVTLAQTAATNATNSATKASNWSDSDVEIEPGRRSAKYWAGVATGAVAGVSSFKGRSGPVVPVANDYNTTLVYRGASTLESSLTTIETNISNVFSALVGGVFMFAMVTPPSGYLECNGAAISRTTYAALFAKIGVTFGVGDGSTTFNLPDLRGMFVRGFDNGRTLDPSRVFGTNQQDLFRSHGHAVSDPSHAHAVYDPGHSHTFYYQDRQAGGTTSGYMNASNNVNLKSTNASGTGIGIYAAVTGITIAAAGGSETRPWNVALLFAIKY